MDKVRPGDALRLSAEFINRTIDTNELARRRDLRPPGLGSPFPPGIVAVRNDSALVRQALDPIHVSGYVAGVADALSAPVFVGLLNDSLPHWGVCLERIAPGEVGRVQVSGVTAARITVLDSAHSAVAVSPADWSLTTSAEGSAALLGAANGYGTIVLRGSGGGTSISWVRLTGFHADSPADGVRAFAGNLLQSPVGVSISESVTVMIPGIAEDWEPFCDWSLIPPIACVPLPATWDGATGSHTETVHYAMNPFLWY
jgi:hypothetical protein